MRAIITGRCYAVLIDLAPSLLHLCATTDFSSLCRCDAGLTLCLCALVVTTSSSVQYAYSHGCSGNYKLMKPAETHSNCRFTVAAGSSGAALSLCLVNIIYMPAASSCLLQTLGLQRPFTSPLKQVRLSNLSKLQHTSMVWAQGHWFWDRTRTATVDASIPSPA